MIRLRFSKLQNDPLIWLAAFHAETAGTWTPWFVDSLLLIRAGVEMQIYNRLTRSRGAP
jgi:hypothetical protein